MAQSPNEAIGEIINVRTVCVCVCVCVFVYMTDILQGEKGSGFGAIVKVTCREVGQSGYPNLDET